MRYSAGGREGHTLVQLEEDLAKCTARVRGDNKLPPDEHVIHHLVHFAAEQHCDVVLYSMNDHDVVEEIAFLKRGDAATQRASGGDDTVRQTAVFVSAGAGATRRSDARGTSAARTGTARTHCWIRFSMRAGSTAMLSRAFLFGSGCRDAIAPFR